jgi:glucosamine--fructose-6-phosphate aminotransferase (isomerizing)
MYMCGIVGFLGKENAFKILFDGLIQLQNRGYDSAGIALFQNDNKHIECHKYASDDNESALERLKPMCELNNTSQCGIAHTRWATHGAKTDANSHPHASENGKFYLVHNGIIENYQELKKFLSEKGIAFVSQTDTEIVVQLLAFYYEDYGNVTEAIRATTSKLTGTWGLAIICKDNPHALYCTRHGSPLLVGLNGNCAMVTSEQSGFCNVYSKYIVLNNHDICVLQYDEAQDIVTLETKDSYEEKNALQNANDLNPFPYAHWTLKEIKEQIDSTLRAISLGGRLLSNYEVKLGGLNAKKSELMELDNIILLGCGTSYHAGMMGMRYLKDICDFNTVQLFDGAEFGENDIPKRGKTGLILLSQSGETKDLHRCISIAQKRELFMIGVVNVVDSQIAREVHCGCYLNAGREVAVASTKAYTSQVILLSMIAIWFAQSKNINESMRIQMIKDLRQLYLDVENTLKISFNCISNEIVPLFKGKQHCFLLGKGMGESVAKEGSLKIKEISYIHSEGYSTSSLKHGPFALLEKDFPVILIGPNNEYYEKTQNAYEEIKSRHAKIIMITNKPQEDKDHVIIIPTNATFQELLCILPLQILAYYLSLDRGLNPDMPRNLAKVVTVE